MTTLKLLFGRGSAVACAFAVALLALPGCGGDQPTFVSVGTAPIGGAFNPVGNALCETLNRHSGRSNWEFQAKATKGSQENIRRLTNGELQLALSNSAITYHAVRGTADWDEKHEVRAVMTLAPNVAMFITRENSGIRSIADLKGKRVICGPAGAGFEMFLEPLVAAHGVSFADFVKLNDNQSGAVDKLADGNADAAFLGGAVPTGSIQQACSQMDVYFIPFDEEAKKKLVRDYPFFNPVTVPRGTYSDLAEDYEGLNVGSMHLITSAGQSEELVYQTTRTLWENRESIGHPVRKFITEENAARYTGTDFHPGAIRFYREIGIWPEEKGAGDGAQEG